jgi:hypothetical protein
MFNGFETGFGLWWVFPLLCLAMMVLCMFSRPRGGAGLCGFGRRRIPRRHAGPRPGGSVPQVTPPGAGTRYR